MQSANQKFDTMKEAFSHWEQTKMDTSEESSTQSSVNFNKKLIFGLVALAAGVWVYSRSFKNLTTSQK